MTSTRDQLLREEAAPIAKPAFTTSEIIFGEHEVIVQFEDGTESWMPARCAIELSDGRLVAEITVDEPVFRRPGRWRRCQRRTYMIKVAGSPYHCEKCGSNCFSRYCNEDDKYECNGCGLRHDGER